MMLSHAVFHNVVKSHGLGAVSRFSAVLDVNSRTVERLPLVALSGRTFAMHAG